MVARKNLTICCTPSKSQRTPYLNKSWKKKMLLKCRPRISLFFRGIHGVCFWSYFCAFPYLSLLIFWGRYTASPSPWAFVGENMQLHRTTICNTTQPRYQMRAIFDGVLIIERIDEYDPCGPNLYPYGALKQFMSTIVDHCTGCLSVKLVVCKIGCGSTTETVCTNFTILFA